jgi:GNAT superfamily N-acetyltransferase
LLISCPRGLEGDFSLRIYNIFRVAGRRQTAAAHDASRPALGVTVQLSAPLPVNDLHEVNDFFSGVGSLDDWLKKRARPNQVSGASRTFVVADNHRVVGYYALASGAIAVQSSAGRIRRNMPDPIPVAVLGRLAIDRSQQSRGLGRALFRDCVMRVAHAAGTIGIRGIVVHAISKQAKAFYLALGFDASPNEPMTLMVTLADIRSLLK